jgi:hypothetical protein
MLGIIAAITIITKSIDDEKKARASGPFLLDFQACRAVLIEQSCPV